MLQKLYHQEDAKESNRVIPHTSIRITEIHKIDQMLMRVWVVGFSFIAVGMQHDTTTWEDSLLIS